jgi:hypothetical protein
MEDYHLGRGLCQDQSRKDGSTHSVLPICPFTLGKKNLFANSWIVGNSYLAITSGLLIRDDRFRHADPYYSAAHVAKDVAQRPDYEFLLLLSLLQFT